MRPAILLICCCLLLLVGCPASDVVHPSDERDIDSAQPIGGDVFAQSDAPLVEMFDLPPDYVDPPIERTGAGITQGTVTLAGSINTIGDASPKNFNLSVLATDVVLIHIKATAVGELADVLAVEVALSGVATPLQYQVPVDGQWHYQAMRPASSGSSVVHLHNRPDVTGELNAGAVDVTYFFKSQAIEGAHEIDDDENPATITDFAQGTTLDAGEEATQSLYRVLQPASQDLEDWYYIRSDNSTAPLDLLLTFSTYGQRYTPTQYRITFYARVQPYPNFAAVVLKQAGLPFILTEKTAGKVFKLSHLHRYGYFVQIVAMPRPPLPGSNVEYQLHSMLSTYPVGINYVVGENTQIGVANEADVSFLREIGCFPGSNTTLTWEYGGGATCQSSCTTALPNLTLGAAGTYTGSVRVDWSGGSTTREFSYEVGAIDPDWRVEAQTVPSTYKTPIVIPDGNYSHVVYLNTTDNFIHHAELRESGFQSETTVMRGLIRMGRRTGIVHRGRIFLAYVDFDTHYLFVLVSKDTTPQAPEDWVQYSLAQGASSTFPVQLASMGDQVVLIYGAGYPATTAMFARATVPEPLAAAQWNQSPMVTSTTLEQATIASHNGRWWSATMTNAGLLRLGYARIPTPHSETDWVWMDLATDGEPGDKPEATPRLVTVGDRLAVGYSAHGTDEITSMIGLSDHAMPFNAAHFKWTAVDRPALFQRLPGIALGSDGTHLFSFTSDDVWDDGYLAFGDLPAGRDALRLVNLRPIASSSAALYSMYEMVYEPDTNVMLVVWTYPLGPFKIVRITL